MAGSMVLQAALDVYWKIRHPINCWVLACFATVCWHPVANAEAIQRPNILLIFTDDQGWNDVGCYGSEIPTPNIDEIARGGLKFNQFYVASSICTPSRFGLLTGRLPSRSRDRLLGALMFMADSDRQRGIQADEITIARWLSQHAGYDTALIGKWHLGHGSQALMPLQHGFGTFRGHTGGCIDYFTMTYGKIPDWWNDQQLVSENGYATELITAEAVGYLQKQSATQKPFFLYVAYNAPHFGKGYSPADDSTVNLMQPQAADLQRVAFIEDKVRREFAAMTVNLDDGVGKLMRTLRETGLEKNTLVIFLTDHGGDPVYGGSNKPLRAGKATLYEGGIRVPCLMRWPGNTQPQREVETPCSSLDLFPTLARLAAAPASDLPLDGIDLSQAILGQSDFPPLDREFFWELGAHAELKRQHWAALRQGDWKFVRSPQGGDQLFNLGSDPGESNNRAKQHPDRLEAMRQRWESIADECRSR